MSSWFAFVRYSEDPHDLDGHVFATYAAALAWRERAEQRAGVIAAGMLPEAARERARQFVQDQRR